MVKINGWKNRSFQAQHKYKEKGGKARKGNGNENKSTV